MSNADLTIIIPLFNKEQYIAEALDSVFAQKTTFKYKVIVADDCSTDKSLDIVARYDRAHPNIISVLKSESNQGLFRNVIRAYARIDTPYFTVLGPDDYWCDNFKIQKSVEFLSGHPDYSIYVTDTWVLQEDGSRRRYIGIDHVVDSDFPQWLAGTAVVGNALGSVLRNVVFTDGLPENLKKPLRKDQEESFRGDTFITATHIQKGKAHYVPECDAVYRVTKEGLWQGSSDLKRMVFSATIILNLYEYFGACHDDLLEQAKRINERINEKWMDYVSSIPASESVKVLVGEHKDNMKRFASYYSPDRFSYVDIKRFPQNRTLRYHVSNVWQHIGYVFWKHMTSRLLKSGVLR